jgi:hypothetical protein
MRHVQIEKQYGNGINYYTFYILSDLHVGNLIDEKQLDDDIKEIKNDKTALVILGGDLIDAIAIKDKRFDAATIADWVSLKDVIGSQIRYLSDKLKPISDKVIFSVPGNHETKAAYLWERDIHGEICRSLNILEAGALTTFSVVLRQSSKNGEKGGTRTLFGVCHHGVTAGKTEINCTVEPVKMMMDWPNSRIAIASHSHVSGIELLRKPFITTSGIDMKDCIAIRGGSYLIPYVDGVTSYIESRNIRPAKTGSIRFYYKPKTDIITVDLNKIGGCS